VSTTRPEGQVVSVVRPGFTLNGRVLRPAQVIIARKPEPKA
jgi:molecular chaperone GrpE (heat shock protein)